MQKISKLGTSSFLAKTILTYLKKCSLLRQAPFGLCRKLLFFTVFPIKGTLVRYPRGVGKAQLSAIVAGLPLGLFLETSL